jgi:hypothetical protein
MLTYYYHILLGGLIVDVEIIQHRWDTSKKNKMKHNLEESANICK